MDRKAISDLPQRIFWLREDLKARINSIGKARENSIVEKDVKKIEKC